MAGYWEPHPGVNETPARLLPAAARNIWPGVQGAIPNTSTLPPVLDVLRGVMRCAWAAGHCRTTRVGLVWRDAHGGRLRG
jgi:hypothetical protein